MDVSGAYRVLFTAALIILAVLVGFCFVRAIKGPKIPDRIVAINMIGTITIIMIAVLSVFLGEEGLVDICLIYAMISFLAVVVITKVYMGAHEEAKHSHEHENLSEQNDDKGEEKND